jgi:hypothetical protein
MRPRPQGRLEARAIGHARLVQACTSHCGLVPDRPSGWVGKWTSRFVEKWLMRVASGLPNIECP